MSKTMKYWLFNKASIVLYMCLFGSSLLMSQNVTGQLLDEAGMPLIGANVLVEGTTTGTITDVDGKFELAANPGDVLVVSYVGYNPQFITVGNEKNISFSMSEGAQALEEVIIVGYGTRKKSHNTGAIAQVEGAEIAAIQAPRVDDALAGKLSGVLIQNQSGEPGADPKIQIRGASSITGNSNPLIVVDGYPITGTLASVNPNDVESIEVLKDAASAAIYGSRGANGVILITTKKGTAGKTQFNYHGYVSTAQKYRDNINQTASEWADTAEANIADGTWNVDELNEIAPGYVDYKINAFRNSPDVVAIEDHVFGTGNTKAHDLSMSGCNEETKFFASIGMQDVDGVVITQEFERYNARLNVDSKLGERFKTGLNFNGFASNRSALEHDMRDILRGASIHPIYHTAESIKFVQDLDQQSQDLGIRVSRQGGVSDTQPFDNGHAGIDVGSIYDLQVGDPAWDWHYGRAGNGIGGSSNPGTAALIDNKSNTSKTFFGNINSYLQFEILEGLNIKTVLGGDYRQAQANQHALLGGDNRGELKDTYLDQQEARRTSILNETTLNYNVVLGSKHDVSALVGVEFQRFFLNGTDIEGNNVAQLLGEPLNYALLSPEDVIVSEREETIHRESVFGRINYAYDNRYLFSASLRRDGDSRFGANNRYEIFPAVSVGWNLHNESFFNSDGLLSDAKVRFSYGSLGTTSNLGAYNSLSILNPGAGVLGNAFLIPADIANPNLTWQTNTETNVGINLGFKQNRFRLGADYYISDIENILIDQSVSEVFGTSSVRLNSGNVRSSGVELEAGATIINNSKLTWDIGANFSTVNTEITDLGDLEQLPDQIYGTSGRGAVYRNYVGGEIGELWGLETTGWVAEEHMINPLDVIGNSSGEVYVVDQNGDGVIDATKAYDPDNPSEGGDLIKLGTNTPDFYWGLNSSVTMGDLDLGVQFQGSHGGVVYNVDPLYNGSNWGGRLRSSFDAEGDGIEDATGKFYDRARDQTDAVVQDAGFIALRNITLGYTFGSDMFKRMNLGSVRAYAAGTNLLYIMGEDYTSYNPEGVDDTNPNFGGPTTYGHQAGASPVLRTFTFGLNVNF